MAEILTETIRHPSAWYGRDLVDDGSWVVPLEPVHLAEIAKAVESVARRGLPFATLTRDDFPLPTLGPRLRQWQEEVVNGRGFYVLRGLNTRDYTDEQVGTIFWAMSMTTAVAMATSTCGATRPTPTCPSTPIPATSWACSACTVPRVAACRAW